MAQLSKVRLRRGFGIYFGYVAATAVGLVLWQYSIMYAVLSALVGGILILFLAQIGLSLADDLNFEPLQLIANRKDVRRVGKWIGFTAVAFFLIFSAHKGLSLVVHSISTDMLGETFPSESLSEMYYPGASPLAVFFLVLASAGIAGEVIFRLFLINGLWKLTKNAGIAIVLSSVIFSVYYLTPLNSAYKIVWGYPFYHLTINATVGILLGYMYKKLGLESVIIIRTLITFFGFF